MANGNVPIKAYRLPRSLVGALGITHYWDFRDGYIGDDTGTVVDMIGDNDLVYSGFRSLDNIYTTGEYKATFDAVAFGAGTLTDNDSADIFMSPNQEHVGDGTALTNVTIGFWFKRDDQSLAQDLLSKWQTGSDERGIIFRIKGDSGFRFWISADGTNTNMFRHDSDNVVFDESGRWYFATATFDNGTVKLYVDGELIDSSDVDTPQTSIYNSSVSRLLLGGNQVDENRVTNLFDGDMGIAFWSLDNTFTDEEVNQVYRMTKVLGMYN